MCEAVDPPGPGHELFMLWREDEIPEEGSMVELSWGSFTLGCRVQDRSPSKVYNDEPRRLSLVVQEVFDGVR